MFPVWFDAQFSRWVWIGCDTHLQILFPVYIPQKKINLPKNLLPLAKE